LAIRDIDAGEELTNDYGSLNIIAPFPVDAEGGERTTVYPDDLVRYGGAWDKKLKESFGHFLEVKQPLRPVFSQETWKLAEAVARGEIAMASIRECYFHQGR
jgi:hypothetical protein